MSPEAIKALQAALSGYYVLPIGEEAKIICAPLPGRALAAATTIDGVLYVCVDLDKGAAAKHGQVMIDEWRDALMGTCVAPEAVRQPCPLSVVAS